MKEIFFSVIPYAILITALLVTVLTVIVIKIRKIKRLYHSLESDDDEIQSRRKKLFWAYDRLCVTAFVALFLWMGGILFLSAGFDRYAWCIGIVLIAAAYGTYKIVRH